MQRRMNYEKVLNDMDEARLSRMVEPLPLYRPAEAASRIDQAGGPRVLFSPAAETTITYWSKIHQAVRVMRELSKTVLVLLRAYREGQLSNSHAVLRILPVLAMSCFVPGSETLRADLAAILKGSTEDAAGLIKRFRAALFAETSLSLPQTSASRPTLSGQGGCRPSWEKGETYAGHRSLLPIGSFPIHK